MCEPLIPLNVAKVRKIIRPRKYFRHFLWKNIIKGYFDGVGMGLYPNITYARKPRQCGRTELLHCLASPFKNIINATKIQCIINQYITNAVVKGC